jgi:catechol O-methyltransferase
MSTPSFTKGVLLILTSLAFLPVSSTILIASYGFQTVYSQPRLRRAIRGSPRFRAKTILISGIGTPQGLRIARVFYETGHEVIGVDFEADGVYLHARFSKAVRKFYRLRNYSTHYGNALYLRDLVNIAEKEHADLYINCSSHITPADYAEITDAMRGKTSCSTLSLDSKLLDNFSSRDKSLEYMKDLGLPVPELFYVRSRADIHKILHDSQGRKKYTLNAANGSVTRTPRTMLPRRTLSQTYNDVSRIKITKDKPWTMEQCFVVGEQYTTFSVIIGGKVRAFAAAQLAPGNTSYSNIRADNGIGKAMLNYVQAFATKAGRNITTHLSMSFKIDEKSTASGLEWSVLPVDCKINISPPVLLFAGTAGSMALTRAYMTALVPATNGLSTFTGMGALPDSMDHVIAPESALGTYYIGQDLLDLVLRPTVQALMLRVRILQLVRNLLTFVEHVLFWRDGIFEVWDPLPAFLLYHVYMPIRLTMHVMKRHGSEAPDVGLLA